MPEYLESWSSTPARSVPSYLLEPQSQLCCTSTKRLDKSDRSITRRFRRIPWIETSVSPLFVGKLISFCFTRFKTLEISLSQPASPANPAFRCVNLAVRVEDIPVLRSSPVGPETQLSRLEELVLIHNKKNDDRASSNLILSDSPEFIDDQKTVNDFIAQMTQHTLPRSIIVKWVTRKGGPADAKSMKNRKPMEEQYKSDLLFAAQ